MLLAQYYCLDGLCNREWLLLETKNGKSQLPTSGVRCPFCASLYVEWVNRDAYGKKETV